MIFKYFHILLLFNLCKLNWYIRIVNAFTVLEISASIHQELSKNVSLITMLNIRNEKGIEKS